MKKSLIISLILMIAISGCITETTNEEHDYSIEIEGNEMKLLTIQEIAGLWEINSEELLQNIIQKFDLKENYTTNSTLETLREEYKFSPAQIKDIAEEMKQGIENE